MTDNTTWQGDAPEPTRNGVLVDGEQVVLLRGGQLRAVALRSGARRWQIDSDSHAIYPVAPGFILATERTGSGGHWDLIDAQTGQRRWRRSFSVALDPAPWHAAGVLWGLHHATNAADTTLEATDLHDGTVIRALPAPHIQQTGGTDGTLWATQYAHGSARPGLSRLRSGKWEAISAAPHELIAADAHGVVVLQRGQPWTVCAYAHDGQVPLWRQVGEGPFVVRDDAVLIAAELTVHCIERHTGTRRWSRTLSGEEDIISLSAAGERVYAEAWAGPHAVLDPQTGAVLATAPEGPREALDAGAWVVLVSDEQLRVTPS